MISHMLGRDNTDNIVVQFSTDQEYIELIKQIKTQELISQDILFTNTSIFRKKISTQAITTEIERFISRKSKPDPIRRNNSDLF